MTGASRRSFISCAELSTLLKPYGGRFLVRGGKVEVLEGGWTPKRFVIVEFPSTDKAREWWHSAEYAEPKALRQATSRTEMILVEGI